MNLRAIFFATAAASSRVQKRARQAIASLLAWGSVFLVAADVEAQPRHKSTEGLELPVLFQDRFDGNLGQGWYWRREHREAWRISTNALEVLIEPGNMWGPANDAKNVLLRPAPALEKDGMISLGIEVTFQNTPTNQYEQCDLVWYLDDSNMVKLGRELVDGKLSVVMGREEKDKTRTVAIIPLDLTSVRLRFFVKGDRIRGQFRPAGAPEWQDAGECDLPAPAHAVAKISLQCYQGSEKAEHWARISEFRVRRRSANEH